MLVRWLLYASFERKRWNLSTTWTFHCFGKETCNFVVREVRQLFFFILCNIVCLFKLFFDRCQFVVKRRSFVHSSAEIA